MGSIVVRVMERHLQATQVDPAVAGFLRKLARGIKGMLNVHVLRETFKLLPGWEIRDGTGARAIKESSILERLFTTHGHKLMVVGMGGKEGFDVRFPSQAEAEEGKKTILHLLDEGKPPANPVVGKLYAGKVLVHEMWRPGDWTVFLAPVWMGVPAWTVKAPSGSSVEFMPAISYTGKVEDETELNPGLFWTFAYKNGLKEQATKVVESLGEAELHRLTAPTTFRDIGNTGTCSVCFSNVKLAKGTIIMRHGWAVEGQRRPGDYGASWHTGPCFGVGWKPFELSPDGTVNFLEKGLKPSLKNAEGMLTKWKSPPEEIKIEFDWRGRPLKTPKVLLKGMLDYSDHVGKQVAKFSNDIKNLKQDIIKTEGNIRDWKLKPLPGEK